MAVSSKFEGEKEFFQFLAKLQSDAERKELLENIGAYGVSSTQQRFLEEKSPDGAAWEKSRRAEAMGGKTLRLSNRLFQSFTFLATSKAVEWGTNVIYAGIHHFGGVIRPVNKKALAFSGLNGQTIFAQQVTIPARPMLGISTFDGERIAGIGKKWVEGMV